MADNTELLIRIRADIRDAVADLRKTNAELRKTGPDGQKSGRQASAGLDRVGRSARRNTDLMHEMRSQLAGLFAIGAIIHFNRELTHTQVELQKIQFTLQAATGSAETAHREFEFVAKISEQLGTNLQGSAIGYARLAAAAKAANIPLAAQHDLFIALSRASSVLHLSQQETQSSLLALEQMFSKGTVQAQELRLQLGQTIPGLVENFTHALGVTGKEFESLLSRGALLTKDVLPALIQSINAVAPDNALTESIRGTNAQLNRMQNALFMARAQLSSGGYAAAVSEAAIATADLAAAFGVAAGASDDAEGAFSGLGTVIRYGLGGPIVAVTALFRTAGTTIAGFIRLVESVGPAAADLSNIRNPVTFARGIRELYQSRGKVENELSGIRDVYVDQLNDIWKDYTAALDKIAHPPSAGEAGAPQIADYAAQLKKLQAQMREELGGATRDATSRATSQTQQLIAALQQQAATYGQTAEQVQLYRLQTLGATDAQIQQAKALIDAIQQKKDDAAATKAQAAAEEELVKQMDEKHARQAQQARDILDQLDPSRAHAREVEQAKAQAQALVQVHRLTQQQADAYVQLVQQGKQSLDELNQFAVQAARNIEDAFAEGFFDVMQGKFDDLPAMFKRALDQMIAQALAAKLASAMFGEGFTSGKSSDMGGWVATAGKWLASIFHDGGVVGASSAPMRAVPAPLFANAPRLHSGLAPDEFPAILQRGERVIPRGESAGHHGNVEVNLQVIDQSTGAKTYDTQQSPDGRTVRLLIRDEMKSAHGDGSMARTMRDVYGMRLAPR